MKGLILFSGALWIALICLLMTPMASACPDCPFPMKISRNQWLLPNSSLILSIDETRINSTETQIRVALYDRTTSEELASGFGSRRKGQRQLDLTLMDSAHRRITGMIYWINFNRSVIKAKFSCLDNGCSIANRLNTEENDERGARLKFEKNGLLCRPDSDELRAIRSQNESDRNFKPRPQIDRTNGVTVDDHSLIVHHMHMA